MISDNMTQKPLFYVFGVFFFAKRLLQIALSWQHLKSQVIKKLFERVNYMLKLKVTTFQLPTPNGF